MLASSGADLQLRALKASVLDKGREMGRGLCLVPEPARRGLPLLLSDAPSTQKYFFVKTQKSSAFGPPVQTDAAFLMKTQKTQFF